MFNSFIYAYKSYSITYHDIEFYVIKDSSSDEVSITLLKAEPLSREEVNLYGGVGTENNYVNKYERYSMNTVYDANGYGEMTYYSSNTCKSLSDYVTSGCIADYASSDVKHVVDAWASARLNSTDLTIDYTGYAVRLIRIDELVLLDYIKKQGLMNEYYVKSDDVPSWVYSDNYIYWGMVNNNDSYYVSTNSISIRYDGSIVMNNPIFALREMTVRPCYKSEKNCN